MNELSEDQRLGPFGPSLTTNGVLFRVWAPRARRLQLILDPQAEQRVLQMSRADGGFFELCVDHATAGTRYLLQRDEHPPLPDPASHHQPEGAEGASEVVAHGHAWTDQAWRGVPARQMVLLELHVGCFDPEGSYDGVARRLPHLRDLGITAIKLMPLATCAGRRNWGYDGVFHLAPFAGYGDPSRLRTLVDACHAHGIAVLLDVVTNHFGPEGNTMWQLARSFFHSTSNTPWGPGPRFDRESVMAYFDQMVRHYRHHYHFDGFRFDAFQAIPVEHRRTHLCRMTEALESELGPEDHALMLVESPENELSLLRANDPGVSIAQLNFDFQRSAHRLLTGETHTKYGDYSASSDDLATCLDRGFVMLKRYSGYRDRVIGEDPRPVDWATVVNYIQNHDTVGNRFLGQRLTELVDERSLRAAMALLLLQPGIPYMLMGDEWSTRTPFLFFSDFSPGLGRRIAAHRRRAFAELRARPTDRSAPEPQDPRALEVSRLRWEETDHPEYRRALDFMRELIAVRRDILGRLPSGTTRTEARAIGRALFLDMNPDAGEPYRLRLIANLGDTPVETGAHAALRYTSWASDEQTTPALVPPRTTWLVAADAAQPSGEYR